MNRKIGGKGTLAQLTALVVVLGFGGGHAMATAAPPVEALPAKASPDQQVERKLTAAEIQGGMVSDIRMGAQFGLSELAASGFRVDMDVGYQFENGLGLVLHGALSVFPQDAYYELRVLEEAYDYGLDEERIADYIEVHAGVRSSWLFIGNRVRLTAQGSYGLTGDVLIGMGHGLNLLSQLDYRVYTGSESAGTIWLGLSAGASIGFIDQGQLTNGSLSATLQVHL